ncbi:MAG: hypothetical protein QOI12_2068 [Alphaproteobacteria bacterium]|jgi:hypothetical protein|nr:hypothetical protein [Alphaproteobacteria bacterium]
MKQSSTRELFDYWNTRRGLRPAPDRADIEPGAIRRVLADTFILAFDARGDHPFRIAGTRVCAAFGRELKGEAFVRIWSEASRATVRDLLAVVGNEAVAAVASARGINAEGVALELELLMLPLGHRGRTDARVLGALVPSQMPYWFGISMITELTLGTLRYLAPGTAPASVPGPQPVVSAGRLRHGLVVYDGGQI